MADKPDDNVIIESKVGAQETLAQLSERARKKAAALRALKSTLLAKPTAACEAAASAVPYQQGDTAPLPAGTTLMGAMQVDGRFDERAVWEALVTQAGPTSPSQMPFSPTPSA